LIYTIIAFLKELENKQR